MSVRYAHSLVCATLCFAPIFSASAHESKGVEFSGFGRVVAGYLNDDVNTYNMYENTVDITNESLLGLRADVNITEGLHVVGQTILRANDQRDSEVQWLYLDYRPTDTLSFKLGRQRLPLFHYSEIIDVGFAYPWISLPSQIYRPFVFADYDGILGSYEFSTRDIFGSVDLYYGGYDGDIIFNDRTFSADVDDLMGIAGNAQVGQYSVRASYHRGNAAVVLDDILPLQQALQQLGFIESANLFTIDNTIEYYQASGHWENQRFFARIEFTQFDSDSAFIPKANNYYVSLGYNSYPFTYHVTYGQGRTAYDPLPNEIPLGVNAQLDALAQQVLQAATAHPIVDLDTIKLGVRYELQLNLALKADITFIQNPTSTLGPSLSATNTSDNSELFQVAIEWVF